MVSVTVDNINIKISSDFISITPGLLKIIFLDDKSIIVDSKPKSD